MKGILAFVALSVIGLLAALYFKLGASKPVALTEGEHGPFPVVSKRHVGAYHKIVPVIEEVEAWAKKNGEACTLSFGEFIDDPDLVAEDRLQSNVGCIVEKAWVSGLPEGFTFRELPRRFYIFAEFEGAPSIGPIKVYPRAKERIKERGATLEGPVIEMYELRPEQGVKTRYYFPTR